MSVPAHRSLVAATLLVLAACASSPQPRFYTLEPVATATGGPALTGRVSVGPVAIPAAVDRPQFVTGAGQNRVDVDEFDRWAEPLQDGVARVVANNLATLLGTPEVAAEPLANFQPDWRVTIRIQRFESVPGQSAVIEAVWVVRRGADGPSVPGHTLTRQVPDGPGPDALAAAHSRGLAAVSADIATALRASAKP